MSYDRNGYLNAYVDGSCINNGRESASAGKGVYFGPNNPMNISEPVYGRQTNNTAEIQAATKAIQVAKEAGYDRVKINTDSQFMKNCAEQWMPNWRDNGWRKADGSEVVNKSELQALNRECKGVDVKWEHVKAHSGNHGNEAADRLARSAASRSRRHY